MSRFIFISIQRALWLVFVPLCWGNSASTCREVFHLSKILGAKEQHSLNLILKKDGQKQVSISHDLPVRNQCGATCFVESFLAAAQLRLKELAPQYQISREALFLELIELKFKNLLSETGPVDFGFSTFSDLADSKMNLYSGGFTHRIAEWYSQVGIPITLDHNPKFNEKIEMRIESQISSRLQKLKEDVRENLRKNLKLTDKEITQIYLHERGGVRFNELNRIFASEESQVRKLIEEAQADVLGFLSEFDLKKIPTRRRLIQYEFLYGGNYLWNVETVFESFIDSIDRGVPVILDYKHQAGLLQKESGGKKIQQAMDMQGPHSVVITGYVLNSKYEILGFQVLNSWGDKFGKNGSAFISKKALIDSMVLAYTLDVEPRSSSNPRSKIKLPFEF